MTLYAATVDFTTATSDTLAGSEKTFPEWLAMLINSVMIVAALLLLIYMLWGGIAWLTAAGDSSKISAARDKMTQAVIGIVVLSASIAIFMLVQTILGIEVLNFTGGTPTGTSYSSTTGSTVTTSPRTRRSGTSGFTLRGTDE
ncbi:MAG: hypothetical protein OEX81_03180 [Candidatus Pacebacteria bacterium]|nr:hypothetical protein [Candidatus Paceibacterota bacterium]